MTLSRRLILAAGLALPSIAALAQAQAPSPAWPTRPVRIVVPFPAGGPVDQTARVLAAKMTALLGQPVVVDNKGGAGGVLGADAVAKAPADGHTLLFSSTGALAIVPHLTPNLPYKPQTDLRAVTQALRVPTVLVVSAGSPYRTYADLAKAVRAAPDKLAYASAGSGTTTHLEVEMLKREDRLQLTHVPYRGAAPALTDLIGGQVALMMADVPVVLPFIQSGKLRALAVTSAGRLPVLGAVPTLAELGVGGMEVYDWYGMLAPARTPDAIVERLHRTVAESLASPELAKGFAEQGVTVVASPPDAFGRFIVSESERWGALAKAVGARLE
jgi:tripartite-type tricarboxylate transporter receptor subunit TctC